MFHWISILGGLLIMMGQHDRSEALFYYFRLEDQVPETHLLRLIDKHNSFEFVRQQLKDSYSETGRPSIDPELLLRMLLIGYLYGIHQRAEVGGRTAHASGVALVYRPGIRSGDSPSLNVLQEPARAVSGIEAVRAVIRTDREAVRGSGAGVRQRAVGGWQFCGSQCGQGEPHSTRAVGGSSRGQSDGAPVSAGSGRAESGGRAGA